MGIITNFSAFSVKTSPRQQTLCTVPGSRLVHSTYSTYSTSLISKVLKLFFCEKCYVSIQSAVQFPKLLVTLRHTRHFKDIKKKYPLQRASNTNNNAPATINNHNKKPQQRARRIDHPLYCPSSLVLSLYQSPSFTFRRHNNGVTTTILIIVVFASGPQHTLLRCIPLRSLEMSSCSHWFLPCRPQWTSIA
jgi:hypothetical protein